MEDEILGNRYAVYPQNVCGSHPVIKPQKNIKQWANLHFFESHREV